MPDEIRRIDYYYASIPDKPGEGARVLSSLRDSGINLIGVSAFPHGARRSQLDLVPEDSAALAKAAKTAGLKLSAKKSGFRETIARAQSPTCSASWLRQRSTSRQSSSSAPARAVLAAWCG
ncbi:MAG TPA: hypothetical protein VG675_15155 [Bryobacteraceae bacterium]|nr:hypothetical protein [Bryobacteraceae bacterium]